VYNVVGIVVGKRFDKIVFSSLPVLGSEETLNKSGGLFLDVLKIHDPFSCRVICAEVELLSEGVLMELS
jgi:hypothetical protein